MALEHRWQPLCRRGATTLTFFRGQEKNRREILNRAFGSGVESEVKGPARSRREITNGETLVGTGLEAPHRGGGSATTGSWLLVSVAAYHRLAAAEGVGPVQRGMATAVDARSRDRIAVIGSGNWGSVAARLLATNARRLPLYDDEVRMWVFEEKLPTGELLSEVINQKQENVKYLPGVKLGLNVVADPIIESAVENATMLVFVTPHQFIDEVCSKLKGKIRPDAKAISLVKGMEVKKEGPRMISSVIKENLGIDCSVLMGANIANEIAMEKFSEATVGCSNDKMTADKWVEVFATPYFEVTAVDDVKGVELCGTLKNVVAIAAGLVDGLNMGNNTKAAIMRIGLKEMMRWSKLVFPSVQDSTFFESCGVADVITTCYGGRNRKVADAFARHGGKRSFDELEAELLGGQKLQGVLTAHEVFAVLQARHLEQSFPLFSTVYAITAGKLPPSAIVEYKKHSFKSGQFPVHVMSAL